MEHRIRNAGVACSSHAGGTIFFQNYSLVPSKRGLSA